MKSEYDHPEYTHTISADHLSKEDRVTQLEVMRTWFFQNYQNPVEECPYISNDRGQTLIIDYSSLDLRKNRERS